MPIVALTADAFDEDAARSREAGMDGHLAKPYTRDQLRELCSKPGSVTAGDRAAPDALGQRRSTR